MKDVMEYQRELDVIVNSMDDEAFEMWLDSMAPHQRFEQPQFVARYRLLKAKRIVEWVARQRAQQGGPVKA